MRGVRLGRREIDLYSERDIKQVVRPLKLGRKRQCTNMPSQKDKAAEFRKEAAECLKVAKQMSLKADNARMIKIVEHWLQLATRAEAEPEMPDDPPKDRA